MLFMKYYEILQVNNENIKSYFGDAVFVYLPLLLDNFNNCAGADFYCRRSKTRITFR